MKQRAHTVGRIGAPVAVRQFAGLRAFKAIAVGDETFPDAGDDRRDFVRQPAMAAGIFRAFAVQIEMKFDRRRPPSMHRALDHRRPPGMVGPAGGTAGRVANRGDRGQIGFGGRGGIGRDTM